MSETVANAVIYARFSSHSQNETSIEGQLKVCNDFCEQHGYRIVDEYIDRAITGKTDNRPEFQKMIEDASKGSFQYIIVYQLDRFSRSRYDSAIYKHKLKKLGVKVLSAKENIADDPSGILMESVLEGMAEYYSAELAVKVRRGMTIKAEKAMYVGGVIPYGYIVNSDRTFGLHPEEAPMIKGIFEQYVNGCPIKKICDQLNAIGFKTRRGGQFKINSVSKILHSERYIGTYVFSDIVIPDGMPRIISDETFKQAQLMLKQHKLAPSASRDVQYLLTGKLFCGECNEPWTGHSGTGKSRRYYYYLCSGRRKHKCDMDYIPKDVIETRVLDYCRSLLQDSVIDRLLVALMKLAKEDYNKSELASLEKQLDEVERRMMNTTNAIVECDVSAVRKSMYAEMEKLDAQKTDLEIRINQFTKLQHKVNESDVRKFLIGLRDGSYDNEKTRKALIETLINRVYVFKNKLVLILNSGHRAEVISDDMLNEIKGKMNDYSSSLCDNSPPQCTKTNTFCISHSFVIIGTL